GVLRVRRVPDLRRLRRLLRVLGAVLRRHDPHHPARAAPVLGAGPVHHLRYPPHRHGDPSTPGPHHQKEHAMKRFVLVALLFVAAPSVAMVTVFRISSINAQTGESAGYASTVIAAANLATKPLTE